MAFVTIGVKLPHHVARALVTVFFGVVGFLVAWWALADAAASYEAFLLLIAYWIGPWLGVVFADQYLRQGQPIAGFLYDRGLRQLGRVGVVRHRPGGIGAAVLQPGEVRRLHRRAVPQLGDITFFVGFLFAGGALSAAVPVDDRRRARRGMTPPRRCSTSPTKRPERAWPKAGFRSAPRCSAPTACCSAAVTTGGCSTTTRRSTPRPTPSATPAASATTARRSWSPRCRRAGTAAGWCASSTSVPW